MYIKTIPEDKLELYYVWCEQNLVMTKTFRGQGES